MIKGPITASICKILDFSDPFKILKLWHSKREMNSKINIGLFSNVGYFVSILITFTQEYKDSLLLKYSVLSYDDVFMYFITFFYFFLLTEIE